MKKVFDFLDRTAAERQAAAWLVRLDGHEPLSAEERRQLHEWLSRKAGHRQQLHRLAKLWSNLNVLTELAVPLDKVQQAPQRRYSGRAWLAAASIAIVSLVGGLTYQRLDRPATEPTNLYATAVGQHRSIRLSDGSVIVLNTDSQIRVQLGSEFRDVVLLRGEAYFTVAENISAPFRVWAGIGVVRAVGTAFSVYLRGDAVDVMVDKGTVIVGVLDERTGVANPQGTPSPLRSATVKQLGTLNAGQVATINSVVDTDSEHVAVLDDVSNVDVPSLSRRLSWTEGVLYFSGQPLAEVVREIGRYTTVQIEFADAEVGAIRIGGRFPVGETETMLETLQDTFGLRVEYLSDNRVRLSSGRQ